MEAPGSDRDQRQAGVGQRGDGLPAAHHRVPVNKGEDRPYTGSMFCVAIRLSSFSLGSLILCFLFFIFYFLSCSVLFSLYISLTLIHTHHATHTYFPIQSHKTHTYILYMQISHSDLLINILSQSLIFTHTHTTT